MSSQPVPVGNQSMSQFDAKRVLGIVIRRRWIILAIAIPIIIIAYIGTWSSTASYMATTRMLVETKMPETPSFDRIIVNYDVLMSTEALVSQSIPVATMAAEAIIDSLGRFNTESPELAAISSVEKLRDLLLENVDGSQVGESNILQISFSHPNPDFCLLAVREITRAYGEYSVENERNQEAIGYYDDQIFELRSDVDSLMATRSRIVAAAGLSAYTDSPRESVGQIRGLESELFKAEANRSAIDAKLRAFRAAIDADPGFVPMVQGESENMRVLKGLLDEQQVELNSLKVQFQAESEYIRRQQELVDLTGVSLARERDAYLTTLEVQFLEAASREASLREAITGQRAVLDEYPDYDYRIKSLDLAISTQNDLLERLRTKRGEVKIKAMTDYRISKILPLDQPVIAGFVGGSRKVLYLSLATVFAFVLGLLVSLFVENQDHRIYDRRTAEYHLELPVLGAISPRESSSRSRT
ncbi:MAG: hypothetical protein GY838_19955 [bacterium]|nr:hypothetical protein [bacterium]